MLSTVSFNAAVAINVLPASIGTRSGLAYLRAWRGENAADTTDD